MKIFRKVRIKVSYFICFQVLIFILITSRNPTLWKEFLIIMLTSTISSIYIIISTVEKRSYTVQNKYKIIEDTISMADKTLPYFRQGLNKDTASVIAKIVKNLSNVPAVAITDKKNILAFIGTGCEKHPIGYPIRTEATIDAIENGEIKIIRDKNEFNCRMKNCDCPLESAIIVPLFNKGTVIGSLKFYETKKGKISKETIKLASGIGKLLTMQIELADLSRQTQLATKAKLDALQAQVNPHFLFNALNTINMYIYKNPKYARKLIVRLSTLLRYLLGKYGRFITLGEELSYIEDYAVIEKARFKDKLRIEFGIEENIKDIKIPVLTVQPLVQNAIIHGILPKDIGGTVKVSAHRLQDEILISVTDDGIGIKEDRLKRVYEHGFGTGCGVGIPNVNERLKILYGEEYGLKIESNYNLGTKAYFKIPLNDKIMGVI